MIRVPRWLMVVIALVIVVGLTTPALAEEGKQQEIKGKIKSVSADKKEFVFTNKDNKDMTFQLADDAKVRLADKDAKLNDLKAGDEATVVYEKKGEARIAREVRVDKK